MKCGETFPTDTTKHGGGLLSFDACFSGPLVIVWNGDRWMHWCSAACALFGRHVDGVRVLPGGGAEVPTR